MDLQSQLDDHVAAFSARQAKWDDLIARGRVVEKQHQEAADAANRRKAKAGNLHDAAHVIHHTIDAGSRYASVRLINRLTGRDEHSAFARLNRQHATVDQLAAAQAGRLDRIGAFSDEKFWKKYQAHLEKGNYRRAEWMLNTHAQLAVPLARLTSGKRGAERLRAEIREAYAIGDAHKENRKLLEKAEKKMHRTERAAAKILHHLLDRDEVRALMRSDMAKNSTDPNVKLLMDLHQGHARTSRIQDELAKRRGVIDLDGIAGSMRTLHRQALLEERQANHIASAAEKRQQKVSAYVESCATARRYETMLAHSATHTSRDLLAELRDYAGRDLSKPENREMAERLVKFAQEKRDHSLDQDLAGVNSDLAKMAQADFVGKDIGLAPDKAYRQKIIDQAAHTVAPSFGVAAKMPLKDFLHLAVVPRVLHKMGLSGKARTSFETASSVPDETEIETAAEVEHGVADQPGVVETAAVYSPVGQVLPPLKTPDPVLSSARLAGPFLAARQNWRVENFGEVRPQQSKAFNKHLQNMLAEFDAQYRKSYQAGTPAHEEQRGLFAESISNALLDQFKDNQESPAALRSESTHRIQQSDVLTSIRVRAETRFDGATADLSKPFVATSSGSAHVRMDNAYTNVT